MRRLLLPIVSAALAALCSAAPSAEAKDLCVKPATRCPVGNSFTALQPALDAAAATNAADTVFLGDSIYTATSAGGFVYDNPSGPLELVGKGYQSVLAGVGNATSVLQVLSAGPGSEIRDLRVALEAVGAKGIGLRTAVDTDHVLVIDDSFPTPAITGVQLLAGADAANGYVRLFDDGSVATLGIRVAAPGSQITHVDAIARAPFRIDPGATGTVLSRVTGRGTGGGVQFRASASVRDSRFVVPKASGTPSGISVGGMGVVVDVFHCTIAGPGEAAGDASGMYVSSSAGTNKLDVKGTIVTGFKHSLTSSADPGAGADIHLEYSAFNALSKQTVGGGTITSGNGNGYYANPGFLDAATGDLRLRHDSPLVDAGGPGPFPGEIEDLAGLTRIRDGNGDGAARIDIGAYEYQRTPPHGHINGPATGEIGQPVVIGAEVDGGDPGDELTFEWRVDGVVVAQTPGDLSHTFSTAGDHTVSLVVTDLSGLASPELTDTIAISAPGGGGNGNPPGAGQDPPGGSPGQTPGAGSPGAVLPVVTSLRAAGRHARFRVNVAAKVRLRVVRRGRTVRVRRVAVQAAGKRRVALGRLRRGRYRLVAVATDGAGNRSARAVARWRVRGA